MNDVHVLARGCLAALLSTVVVAKGEHSQMTEYVAVGSQMMRPLDFKGFDAAHAAGEALDAVPVQVLEEAVDPEPFEDFWSPAFVAFNLRDEPAFVRILAAHVAQCHVLRATAKFIGGLAVLPEDEYDTLDVLLPCVKACATAPNASADRTWLRDVMTRFDGDKALLWVPATELFELEGTACDFSADLGWHPVVVSVDGSFGVLPQDGNAVVALAREVGDVVIVDAAPAPPTAYVATPADAVLVHAFVWGDAADFSVKLAAMPSHAHLASVYFSAASIASPSQQLRSTLAAKLIMLSDCETAELSKRYLMGASSSKRQMQIENSSVPRVTANACNRASYPSRIEHLHHELARAGAEAWAGVDEAWAEQWTVFFEQLDSHFVSARGNYVPDDEDETVPDDENGFVVAEAARALHAVVAVRRNRTTTDGEEPEASKFEMATKGFGAIAAKQSNEVKLRFYALFKQASSGDVKSKRPWAMDFTGRAKWDAWSSLKGTSQEDATQKYIAEFEDLLLSAAACK
jgi:acyl-CoA-binding protein